MSYRYPRAVLNSLRSGGTRFRQVIINGDLYIEKYVDGQLVTSTPLVQQELTPDAGANIPISTVYTATNSWADIANAEINIPNPGNYEVNYQVNCYCNQAASRLSIRMVDMNDMGAGITDYNPNGIIAIDPSSVSLTGAIGILCNVSFFVTTEEPDKMFKFQAKKTNSGGTARVGYTGINSHIYMKKIV